MVPRGTKGGKKGAHGSQKGCRRKEKDRKGSPKGAKVGQSESKVSSRRSKTGPGRPKGEQRATKSRGQSGKTPLVHPPRLPRKRWRIFRTWFPCFFLAFWWSFSHIFSMFLQNAKTFKSIAQGSKFKGFHDVCFHAFLHLFGIVFETFF